MKKFISTLAILVLLSGIADAQISIKKSDTPKPVQLTTLSMSWSWLYQAGDDYYVVMKSDNQFDDHYWLKIGSGKEECVSGLESLMELSDSIGEGDRYEVDNGLGETLFVSQYRMMGVNGLKFYGDGYAGVGYLIPANLKKAIKWIQTNLK